MDLLQTSIMIVYLPVDNCTGFGAGLSKITLDQSEDRWLLDQPIGREIEKFGHVPLRLINAQNLRMLQTTIAMSDDVSGTWDQSQINPLFKTNILRGERFL